MKKYKTAVVGTGFIGVAHIDQLRRLGYVDVVAIADKFNAESVADQLCVPNWYEDYGEMIRREKPDVVHICTPNYLHYDIAMLAMEEGCHVVCEKPLCTSFEQARSMLKKAKETGLMNGVNYHFRYFPMVRELKSMISSGELGPIHAVFGEFVQDWLLLHTDFNWRVVSKQSGATRAVSDIGSHWMDLVETVTGLRINEVLADFMILHKERKRSKTLATFQKARSGDEDYEIVPVDTEDHANIMMRFDNDAVGSLVVSQVMAGRKAKLCVNIGGRHESAEWNSDTCNQLWVGRRNERNEIFEKDPTLMSPQGAAACGYPGGHPEGYPDAMKFNFDAMYRSIEDPSLRGSYATFENGYRELRLCDAVFRSAQTGRWTSPDDAV